MKKSATKKKLSGAAFRKLRRKKLAKQGEVVKRLINMPYVGRIETVNDWHTQIARIYRRTLSGDIPEYISTKLVYIVTAGATIAKALEELKEIDKLRQQLAQLQNGGAQLSNGQDYLPASDSQTVGDDL